MISLKNITKKYDKVVALDHISFEVPQGSLFGLIGPDGAGKSSLFRILATLMLADEGTATVDGMDIVSNFQTIRNLVGYMPGRFSLYQDLSVEENLAFFATVYGTTISENYSLIKDIYDQIATFRNRRAGALSGGMKQKLALSCALVHRPKLLLLDEPTTGVDPESRKEFWQILGNLRKEGITTLVSTPFMDEASLCDQVALIHKGKILAVDSPAQICAKFEQTIWGVKSEQPRFIVLNHLKALSYARSVQIFAEEIHVTSWLDDDETLKKLNNDLTKLGHLDLAIKRVEASIEDVFMEFMQFTNNQKNEH